MLRLPNLFQHVVGKDRWPTQNARLDPLLAGGRACSQGRRNAVHLTSQATALQHPDRVATQIELPPVQPVKGRAGEGVMVVVPALPEGEQPDHPLVATAIVGLELALAKRVADRVDTPGDMMDQ